MKKWILLILLPLALHGNNHSQPEPEDNEVGRYQMLVGDFSIGTGKGDGLMAAVLLLDTVTGKTWIYRTYKTERGLESYWEEIPKKGIKEPVPAPQMSKKDE